jgi:plastocyanin
MKKFNSLRLAVTYTFALCVVAAAQAGTLTVSVVDRDGKPAADAIVILQPEGKGLPKNALPNSITITQEKMQFMPAVSVVPAGAKVRFVNNDPWDHHVRASAAGAAQFSLDATSAGGAQAGAKGQELRLEGKPDGKPAKSVELTMDKIGVQSAVLLGCFIHGSMRGHVYVSDSPWAAKTGADGNAVFDDLPDGKVQVKVWQADQLLDLPVQSTVVGAAPAKVSVLLPVTPRRRRG